MQSADEKVCGIQNCLVGFSPRPLQNRHETMEEPVNETTRRASSIALGFQDLIVRCENPSKDLLKSISGYVEVGGVTAGS